MALVEIQFTFIDNWNAAGPLDRSHIEIKRLHLCLRSSLAASFLRLLYHRFFHALSVLFVLSPLSLRRSFRVQPDLSQRCSPRSQ